MNKRAFSGLNIILGTIVGLGFFMLVFSIIDTFSLSEGSFELVSLMVIIIILSIVGKFNKYDHNISLSKLERLQEKYPELTTENLEIITEEMFTKVSESYEHKNLDSIKDNISSELYNKLNKYFEKETKGKEIKYNINQITSLQLIDIVGEDVYSFDISFTMKITGIRDMQYINISNGKSKSAYNGWNTKASYAMQASENGGVITFVEKYIFLKQGDNWILQDIL